ncbi:MAG: response regulator [Nodosilinea sp. LVE1205-7]|jgi:DNA-binding response OmpR family regulator
MGTFPVRAASHQGRILIIEDDDANRLVFTDYLTYAGFVVLALPGGANLINHLQEFQPDLILLDLGLPDIDGYGLLTILRASPEWGHMAVIVVSGYAFPAEQERARRLGISCYLVKPVHLKELIESIQAVLRLNFAAQSEAVKGQHRTAQDPNSQPYSPLLPPESP